MWLAHLPPDGIRAWPCGEAEAASEKPKRITEADLREIEAFIAEQALDFDPHMVGMPPEARTPYFGTRLVAELRRLRGLIVAAAKDPYATVAETEIADEANAIRDEQGLTT
jgi:hypothetical protein